MKKIISAVLVLTMMLALLSGCGDNSASENNVETSDLYEQVMARFDGELEEGAVIKVLENDTAVELGYVDQLINAFNEAYKDKGISAERMNIATLPPTAPMATAPTCGIRPTTFS